MENTSVDEIIEEQKNEAMSGINAWKNTTKCGLKKK